MDLSPEQVGLRTLIEQSRLGNPRDSLREAELVSRLEELEGPEVLANLKELFRRDAWWIMEFAPRLVQDTASAQELFVFALNQPMCPAVHLTLSFGVAKLGMSAVLEHLNNLKSDKFRILRTATHVLPEIAKPEDAMLVEAFRQKYHAEVLSEPGSGISPLEWASMLATSLPLLWICYKLVEHRSIIGIGILGVLGLMITLFHFHTEPWRLSATPMRVEQYVDRVPWGILFDAYGRATPLRLLLRNLGSENEERRDLAVDDGLWSRALHQYSYYTCTILAVPAVVMTLKAGARQRSVDLLLFLSECVRIGNYRLRWHTSILPISIFRLLQLPFLLRVGLPSLKHEIPKAKAAYEELASSNDSVARAEAQFLLAYCEKLEKGRNAFSR